MSSDSGSSEKAPEDVDSASTAESASPAARNDRRDASAAEEAPPDTATDIRQRIAARGWRQGAVLPAREDVIAAAEMVPYAHQPLPTHTPFWLIVASQDCDVVNDKLAVEPAVELLVATPIESIDQSKVNVRHPRELHFPLARADGTVQPVAVHVRGRAFISRRVLLNLDPDDSIRVPDYIIAQIAGLLADRYNRVAFPDAFERRFKSAKQRLRRILDQHADALFDIFVDLRPFAEVHDEAERYSLTVYAIVRDAVADGPAQRYKALRGEVSHALRQTIRACVGIDLDKVTVCGRDDITMREMESLRQLDFESLSFELDSEKRFGPDHR